MSARSLNADRFERLAAALERIAVAQDRIAAALEWANTPEPAPEGCPHPVEAREPVNGWSGFFCLACEEKVGQPIARQP